MNLSNQFEKGNIQIKKKEQEGGKKNRLSPMSQNYKKYLQDGGTSGSKILTDTNLSNDKKISISRIKENEPKISDIKIVRKGDKKKKHKFTRKKPSKINVKDINEIEKQIELSKKNKDTNPKKELMRKINPSMKDKKIDKDEDKGKDKDKDKDKGSKKRLSRNNKRSSKRKNKKGSRKISFKKSNKISEKDIHRVEKEIKQIRTKKAEDIKIELEKEGIKVSGKSKRLLKDIYLYSRICNIKIQHEK